MRAGTEDAPARQGTGIAGGPMVVVDGVAKRFRQAATAALETCSLEVRARELLCILGPSGSGKTTLLRIIDGLLRPDSGRVLIGGTEVTAPRPDVAMVFQHFGLLPWKTVYDNVAYGLRVQGRPEPEVRRVVPRYIEAVGLTGFEASYPYQLSGGMQQRVGLARALAVAPEELLRIWRSHPKTLVFVTHSIDEAIVLGDRIALMTHRPGRIREIVDVDIARPRDPEAVRLSPRYLELRSYVWQRLRSEVGARGAP